MKIGIIAFLCAVLLSLGAAMSASAGTIVDTDGDRIPDVFDNCRTVDNSSFQSTPPTGTNRCDAQEDFNNDGLGNPCDGDLNNSGGPIVNGVDFAAMFPLLFVGPNAGDLNCSGGVTNGVDFAAMFPLLFLAPGPGASAQ